MAQIDQQVGKRVVIPCTLGENKSPISEWEKDEDSNSGN